MQVFHGSSKDIEKTLKPNRAFDRDDYKPSIYFTDNKQLALLYAINPIDIYINKHLNIDNHYSAMSAHFIEGKGRITVMELYPNMFEDIYHQRVYIYVLSKYFALAIYLYLKKSM